MGTTFKVIAIVQAILGGFLAGASVVMIIAVPFQKMHSLLPVLMSILMTVSIGILGGVILVGALRHIRNPKRSNARDIASTTAVLIWMFVTGPLLRNYKMGGGSLGSASDMLPLLLSIGIPYLLYRFVLKKMAFKAFPDETVPKGDAAIPVP